MHGKLSQSFGCDYFGAAVENVYNVWAIHIRKLLEIVILLRISLVNQFVYGSTHYVNATVVYFPGSKHGPNFKTISHEGFPNFNKRRS